MSLPRSVIEGKFEVVHKISEGGMGAVYKVRHLLLDQPFVIKVIRSQHQGDESLQKRFRREARAATRLRHPNIAEIHDFSIGEEGTAYIVMEFIDGETLKQMLARRGPPALALTLEIAVQSLEALSFLHRQGYLHRDVSPDNLMLTRSLDGEPLVKLIDLGLTKRFEGSAELTTTGMFLGKVRYSAPEKFQGKGLDQRSDVYSFGVLLYQLLTGRCPIEGKEFSDFIAAHLFNPPLDFADTDPEGRVPPGLRRVVLQTLEKEPDKRIATAAELARLLEPFRQPDKVNSMELSGTIALALPVPPADPSPPQPPRSAGEDRKTVAVPLERKGRDRSKVESVARVEAHLASHELKEANAALAEAERAHGIDENLQQLRGQLDQLQHKQREERLKALLEKARRQIAVDEMEKALETLREAEALDGQNVSAQALLMQVRTTVDRARVAKPKRRRVIWGVAAAAALVGLVTLGWTLFEWPEVKSSYQLALDAIEREDWPTARDHLNKAIETDPGEKSDGPYLPHYFLGLVHSRRSNCSRALDEWKVSENQRAIQETPFHHDLRINRDQCWAKYSSSVERLRMAVENAIGFANNLDKALKDPALKSRWSESPQLKESISSALQKLPDLQARFATAEERKDFGEILELEQPVLDLEETLDQLTNKTLFERE